MIYRYDAYEDFKKLFDNEGFFSFTKRGNNPDKLVQLVAENFKGGINEI